MVNLDDRWDDDIFGYELKLQADDDAAPVDDIEDDDDLPDLEDDEDEDDEDEE